jgi:C-terminal processing protease CtpA/Prc
LILIIASYNLGHKAGEKGFVFQPKEFKVVSQNDAPQTVNYGLLWDAIKVVQDKYIDKKPTDLEFLYGAARGAVSAAGDPYTSFFRPKSCKILKPT